MLKQIIYWITKALEYLAPKFAVKVVAVAVKEVKPSASLLRQLKNHFARSGWEWSQCQVIGLRDNRAPNTYQVFNDLLIVATYVDIWIYRCTLDPGKQWTKSARKKYLGSEGGWPGKYLENVYYSDFWKASTYKGKFCLRPKRSVEVRDVDTGKLRKAGDMLVHDRHSGGEPVKFASAGCVVPFNPSLDLIEIQTEPHLKIGGLPWLVLSIDLFETVGEKIV